MLTPKQFAELHGKPYSTVMTWLKNKMIPEASRLQVADKTYYEIPDNAKPPKTKKGRPPGSKNKKKEESPAPAVPLKKRSRK